MAICLDLYRECLLEKDAKVLSMSKEKWMTISCRISITNIFKFDKMVFSEKMDTFWSCAIDDAHFLLI